MTRDGPAKRTVREERTPTPMRRTISKRLGESQREAVQVTLHRDIGADSLREAVEETRETLDTDVSLVDVLLLSLSWTLNEHPAFNATFEDDTHRLYEEHNIGVAVAVDDGLLTPVIADVGSLSLAELARERHRVTALVQAGQHDMSDLRGGTFTVTNLGPFGVDAFTPVINPPEVAILGVNRIRERVVSTTGGVGVRSELGIDLTFDHRVVDGVDAARFLSTLAAFVEHVSALLSVERPAEELDDLSSAPPEEQDSGNRERSGR